MFRSLIKLYLVIIVCAGAGVFFVNHSFLRFFHERIVASERRSLSAYQFVLTDYLARHPGNARRAALEELNRHGSDGFNLTPSSAVRAALNDSQWRDLQKGLIVVSYDNKDYYMPLADGYVVHAHPNEWDDLDIRIYAYLVIALATLVAVVFWVYYHWRDLLQLQAAARSFGSGRLSTRVRLSKKSNIYELSEQFNDMAQRIEASIQQQRDMMNSISHELKTPLARLEFGLALLSSPDSAGRMRERQDALRHDVRELDDLVTELLTISRLEQGEGHLVLMQVAVNELVDSVVASVADDVADLKLTLAVATRGAPVSHVCDPKLVARALLNLIRNSSRYAATSIAVRATLGDAGALVLTVEDDGPGIPPADRDRVFEPFHRLDSSRDRQTGGFGLGLTIVRRVALVHGGDVRLDETPLGGARFIITLPAREWPIKGRRESRAFAA
ncbi:ATP-binding protein [Burkholderia alba]|uniref:ATP-binding protein n=1 Tax=Burkholderia alba TaxID=2683677 RepID=UPI002B061AF0|nr:ATP-binding protein [Burkholderia alba]